MTDLKCKHCERHLGEAEMIVGEIICPNSSCRGTTQFKMIKSDVTEMVRFKFTKPERQAKSKAVEVS